MATAVPENESTARESALTVQEDVLVIGHIMDSEDAVLGSDGRHL